MYDVGADGDEHTLTRLAPGALFGKLGLVGDGVRSAFVVAESPTEVLGLDVRALARIRRRFPYTSAKLFRNLARNLGVSATRPRRSCGPRRDCDARGPDRALRSSSSVA